MHTLYLNNIQNSNNYSEKTALYIANEMSGYKKTTITSNNDDLLELHSILHRNIFKNKLFGSNAKPDKYRYSEIKSKDEALHCKFIDYNTKKAVQILMFDDDTPVVGVGNLEKYSKYLEKLNIPYTFLIQTDNGYQFGLVLNKACWKNSDEFSLLKKLKFEIALKIDGDFNACNRINGIWRNPLAHNHIYNKSNASFSLLKLFSVFGIAKEDKKPYIQSIEISKTSKKDLKIKLSPTSKTQQIIDDGFLKGNRHNFISAIAYKILFEDRSKRNNLLKDVLAINNSFDNPILERQAEKRVQGVLEFEKNMYKYDKEKIRGKYSDFLWINKIHGVRNRQSAAGMITSFKKRESAHKELVANKIKLLESGIINPTIKQLEEVSIFQKSRLYELENEFKKSVKDSGFILMQWIKDIGSKVILEQGGIGILDILKSKLKSTISALNPQILDANFQWSNIFEAGVQKIHKNLNAT